MANWFLPASHFSFAKFNLLLKRNSGETGYCSRMKRQVKYIVALSLCIFGVSSLRAEAPDSDAPQDIQSQDVTPAKRKVQEIQMDAAIRERMQLMMLHSDEHQQTRLMPQTETPSPPPDVWKKLRDSVDPAIR